jgi:hypothetical protein
MIICNAIVVTIDESFLMICKFRKILLDCKQMNKKIIEFPRFIGWVTYIHQDLLPHIFMAIRYYKIFRSHKYTFFGEYRK